MALGLSFMVAVGTAPAAESAEGGDDPSRLSDKPVPLQTEIMPPRPESLIELGESFLGPGPIGPGIELPTGAVWQPSFFAFGTLRSAVQTFDNGDTKFSEWANRLDIFGEFRVTGTERLLVGFRPLDENGRFTSFNFQPQARSDWQTAFNGDLTTLFLEGEIGEIFPFLDPDDAMALDLGFAVGRQPIFIQEGMLINDRLDAVGVTRNALLPDGTSNLRITTLYAWNEVNRGNNRAGNNIEDPTAQLFGLFTEADTPLSTISIDGAYVDSRNTGDGFYLGASAVQRIGELNTSFRALGSFPVGGEIELETDDGGILEQNTRGYLFFGEVSKTLPHSEDLVYLNGFYAMDRFSSAARDPATGGPLGRTGILYSAVGLGRYGSALSNQASDAYGISLGRQFFFDHGRKQLIAEIGGRKDTNQSNTGSAGVALRYQQALSQHVILRLDTFAAAHEDRNASYGARMEFVIKF